MYVSIGSWSTCPEATSSYPITYVLRELYVILCVLLLVTAYYVIRSFGAYPFTSRVYKYLIKGVNGGILRNVPGSNSLL